MYKEPLIIYFVFCFVINFLITHVCYRFKVQTEWPRACIMYYPLYKLSQTDSCAAGIQLVALVNAIKKSWVNIRKNKLCTSKALKYTITFIIFPGGYPKPHRSLRKVLTLPLITMFESKLPLTLYICPISLHAYRKHFQYKWTFNSSIWSCLLWPNTNMYVYNMTILSDTCGHVCY